MCRLVSYPTFSGGRELVDVQSEVQCDEQCDRSERYNDDEEGGWSEEDKRCSTVGGRGGEETGQALPEVVVVEQDPAAVVLLDPRDVVPRVGASSFVGQQADQLVLPW